MIKDRQRYSDSDLQEFKELILYKIEKAERDLALLRESFINDQNNGTDDTSPTFKAFEEGAEILSKEQNAILAGRQEKFIRDLKHALIRIENKTYGICRATGKLISKERLKAVPHATLSIEAKKQQR
ncbi:MAG: TraR/DksA C4-type zinc finger protein [Flavobacteriaceae bacterium]|nr:TraR/DksA C4-type zinc finger protein [Flavobacteriaceae bacterium]